MHQFSQRFPSFSTQLFIPTPVFSRLCVGCRHDPPRCQEGVKISGRRPRSFSTKPNAINWARNKPTYDLEARKVADTSERPTGDEEMDHDKSDPVDEPCARRSCGTTSLLLYVQGVEGSNSQAAQSLYVERLRTWIRNWTTDYVFNNQLLRSSSPLAMNSSGNATEIIFHSSTTGSPIRGSLSLCTTRSLLVRITSIARFFNRTGFQASSLPGERRLIRAFVSALRRDFVVYVIHKSPRVRLRQDLSSYLTLRSLASTSAVVAKLPTIIHLVAEWSREGSSGEAHRDAVLLALQQWAIGLQYDARDPRMPPISTQVFDQGVHVSFAPRRRKVRKAVSQSAQHNDRAGSMISVTVKQHSLSSTKRISLLASTTPGMHVEVQIVLNR